MSDTLQPPVADMPDVIRELYDKKIAELNDKLSALGGVALGRDPDSSWLDLGTTSWEEYLSTTEVGPLILLDDDGNETEVEEPIGKGWEISFDVLGIDESGFHACIPGLEGRLVQDLTLRSVGVYAIYFLDMELWVDPYSTDAIPLSVASFNRDVLGLDDPIPKELMPEELILNYPPPESGAIFRAELPEFMLVNMVMSSLKNNQ